MGCMQMFVCVFVYVLPSMHAEEIYQLVSLVCRR